MSQRDEEHRPVPRERSVCFASNGPQPTGAVYALCFERLRVTRLRNVPG